jgi:S1-C subfamily serine protease
VGKWLVFVAIALGILLSWPRLGYAEGVLELAVAVVADDLTVKPVPAAHFSVAAEPGGIGCSLVTDLQGHASLSLPAGHYRITSEKPVTYLAKTMTWNQVFDIQDGGTAKLQLTSSDAQVSTSNPTRQVDDAGLLYKQLKGGVVTVQTDTSSGSGFIVAPNLIATNSHVVEGCFLTRIRFSRGNKISAIVLCQDKQRDVAFVAADMSAFDGACLLRIAKPSGGEVLAVEGEKVIAIGSPLNQDKIVTSGIVSKVEMGAIISDVNINHGNSGGPLLNMAGEVIGITTFGDTPDSPGPGISGIIPVTEMESLMLEAQTKLQTTTLPKATLLPDVPEYPFPAATLDTAANKDLKHYDIDAPKNFAAFIVTPPVMESLSNAQMRRLAKIKGLRENKRGSKGVKGSVQIPQNKVWEQYVGEGAAVVMVVVQPVLKETPGSQWTRALTGGYQKKMRFRDDFYRMELWRGDKLIDPIQPCRVQQIVDEFGFFTYAEDIAYSGMYFYDSSAFEPGAKVTLKVVRESNTEKLSEQNISEKVQKKVWDDFAPYREEVAKSVKAGS